MIWLFLITFVLFFIFSTFFRTIVLHPFLTVYYSVRDFIKYLKERKWHFMKSGYIICFVGLFGKGKTLATVHYVLQLYKKYNGKKVYLIDDVPTIIENIKGDIANIQHLLET